MKVAIMQPYFFPYIGYISLIKHSDEFILLDKVQFIRHGWIERNRVLKQNGGWLYVQVPLEKFSRETTIDKVVINNLLEWKNKIKAQLMSYKKTAPYYNRVINLIDDIFKDEFKSIVTLNKICLEKICEYLGFSRTLFVYSEMDLIIESPKKPDEWALNICKVIGTDIVYVNPIGGMDFFDKKKYQNEGVKLCFQKMNLMEYNQKRLPFESGLSIIDVMMYNSPDEINIMLDKFELI